MPAWEIIALVVLGIPILLTLIRIGLLGFVIDIIVAILTGGKGGSGGFGGGSSGGGGSSDSF